MVKHLIEITKKENEKLKAIKFENKLGNISKVFSKLINDCKLNFVEIKK